MTYKHQRRTGIPYFNIQIPMSPVKSNKIPEQEGVMTEEKFNESIAELRQLMMNECESFGAFAPVIEQMVASVFDAFDNSFKSGGRTDESGDERVATLEQQVRELQNRLHKIELEKAMQEATNWQPFALCPEGSVICTTSSDIPRHRNATLR